MTAIPAPGSAKAVKMGCTCPVLDNAHGRGYMGGAKGKNGEYPFDGDDFESVERLVKLREQKLEGKEV